MISTGFDPRHQLRHKYNALGERSFELFKDKTLDQTLDSEVAELVKDIETLRHRITQGERSVESGHPAAIDPS